MNTTGRHSPAGTWIVMALFGLFALLVGAAPAAAAPGPVRVAAQQGWVEVTDEPSGVTVALPGAAAPTAVPFGRAYAPAGANVGFGIVDVPGPLIPDLADLLETVAPGLGVTVVESRETEVDGRRALDAELAVDTAGVTGTALVRAVVSGDHVVVLATVSEPGDTAAAARHQRLLDGAELG